MDKDQIKIKKGNLNYDQSGRAYPDNPELKENWDCIWEHDDKYYELVGDNEHKEWEEVNIYDRIIDEVYEKYYQENKHVRYLTFLLREEFINKIKKDKEFSEKWGLNIEERELSDEERVKLYEQKTNTDTSFFPVLRENLDVQNIPTKLITITYKNEKIEIYE